MRVLSAIVVAACMWATVAHAETQAERVARADAAHAEWQAKHDREMALDLAVQHFRNALTFGAGTFEAEHLQTEGTPGNDAQGPIRRAVLAIGEVRKLDAGKADELTATRGKPRFRTPSSGRCVRRRTRTSRT